MSKAFYSGLNRALLLSEVRLIRLLPGQCSDQICCEHVYTFLPEKPFYQALSYVWGSQKASRPILLNGHEYPVTINLHSALRHLRHEIEVKILWIDALCINQADLNERAHQVSSMGEIYRSAANVLVYLGDRIDLTGRIRNSRLTAPVIFHNDDGDSNRLDLFSQKYLNAGTTNKKRKHRIDNDYALDVFCLIRLLAESKHISTLSFGARDGPHKSNRSDRLFEALRRLMHGPCTPWWSRIWVVQETVIPRQVTVIYGRISAPWNMFAQAAFNYTEHIRSCCSTIIESLPRDWLKVLADFSQRVQDIEALRASFFHHSADAGELPAQERSSITIDAGCGDSKEGKQPLLSLLRRFRSRKATDPRDKVYALLGLATTKLVPDYSLSTSQVFTETVIDSIRSTRSLSVLTGDQGRKFRQDLPSWVPDWEAPDYTQRIWPETLDLYDASGEPFLIPEVKGDGRILLIEGDSKDTIERVGPAMSTDNVKVSQAILLEWLNIARENLALRPPGKTRLAWNLLCADIIFSESNDVEKRGGRRTEREDDLLFKLWASHAERSPFQRNRHNALLKTLISHNSSERNEEEFAKVSPKELDLINMIDGSIMSATMNRRFFITLKGYIGLGPVDMKPGDRLFLVEGGRAPFVLRENRDKPSLESEWREELFLETRHDRILHAVRGMLALHDLEDRFWVWAEELSHVLKLEPSALYDEKERSRVWTEKLSQVLQQEPSQALQELSQIFQRAWDFPPKSTQPHVLPEKRPQVLQEKWPQVLQEKLSRALQQELFRALNEFGRLLSKYGEEYRELRTFHKQCERFVICDSVQQDIGEILLWQQLFLERLEQFCRDILMNQDVLMHQTISAILDIGDMREPDQSKAKLSRKGYSTFELVGACYAQGLMDFNETYADIHWQTLALI